MMRYEIQERNTREGGMQRWRRALIIAYLRPCWTNMDTWRSRQRSQRWKSWEIGGALRITVEGWWNRASSWRSAGFGLSLSSFLNSLQSDGHFEVSQSCLNPAWKDAEKREAQKRDRNIQRKRDCRSRTKGRIDDWWNMEEGSESNQKWGEACFMRMTGDKWRKALSAPTQYESYGFFFFLLLFLDVWVICFQQF